MPTESRGATAEGEAGSECSRARHETCERQLVAPSELHIHASLDDTGMGEPSGLTGVEVAERRDAISWDSLSSTDVSLDEMESPTSPEHNEGPDDVSSTPLPACAHNERRDDMHSPCQRAFNSALHTPVCAFPQPQGKASPPYSIHSGAGLLTSVARLTEPQWLADAVIEAETHEREMLLACAAAARDLAREDVFCTSDASAAALEALEMAIASAASMWVRRGAEAARGEVEQTRADLAEAESSLARATCLALESESEEPEWLRDAAAVVKLAKRVSFNVFKEAGADSRGEREVRRPREQLRRAASSGRLEFGGSSPERRLEELIPPLQGHSSPSPTAEEGRGESDDRRLQLLVPLHEAQHSSSNKGLDVRAGSKIEDRRSLSRLEQESLQHAAASHTQPTAKRFWRAMGIAREALVALSSLSALDVSEGLVDLSSSFSASIEVRAR